MLAIEKTDPTLEMRLKRMVISVTRQRGHWFDWFFGVSRIAYPFWLKPPQQFSSRLPSTSTRCAFFSSNRFFTINGWPEVPPTKPGSPGFQVMGLKKWLPRISISAGVMVAGAPPNKMFSPEASRKLLTILYAPVGRLPPPDPRTCASVHDPATAMQWKSVK